MQVLTLLTGLLALTPLCSSLQTSSSELGNAKPMLGSRVTMLATRMTESLDSLESVLEDLEADEVDTKKKFWELDFMTDQDFEADEGAKKLTIDDVLGGKKIPASTGDTKELVDKVLASSQKPVAQSTDITPVNSETDKFCPNENGGVPKTKWQRFINFIKPKSLTSALATAAKLTIWGVALGLTIAFPPAALAVAGGVALLGFMVSAAAIANDEGIKGFTKAGNWCRMFTEVGQNMFVGATGGVGAVVPAIILTADVLEAAVTNYKAKDGLAATAFCGITDGIDKLRTDILAQESIMAGWLLQNIPWGKDPTAGSCTCDSCGMNGDLDSQLGDICKDKTCLPYWYKTCDIGRRARGESTYCMLKEECPSRNPNFLKDIYDGIA